MTTAASLHRVEPSFERLRSRVKSIAAALEEKASIPMVQQHLALIQDLQSDEWWQGVTTSMLERGRGHPAGRAFRARSTLAEPAFRRPQGWLDRPAAPCETPPHAGTRPQPPRTGPRQLPLPPAARRLPDYRQRHINVNNDGALSHQPRNFLMFKIANPTLPDALGAALSASAVDIQLVNDELANDKTFTWDRSIAKVGAPGVYTYISLCDTIASHEMVHIRKVVFAVASRLTPDVSFMCFMTGGVPDDDVAELENRIVVNVHHEDTAKNGKLIVAEMSTDDLEYSMAYLGKFDIMRGVAVTPQGLHGLRSDLRLFEPMPTASENPYFHPPGYHALQIVLKHGVFFFEEIGNGTRLRIVSTVIDQQDLTERIMGILGEGIDT